MTERQEITTTDLAQFAARERMVLLEILQAWHERGLPKGFFESDVIPMLNRNSGCVFLTNSEYQAAAMNGDKLELWHNCPNCGHEGFEDDCQVNDEGYCNECKENEDE